MALFRPTRRSSFIGQGLAKSFDDDPAAGRSGPVSESREIAIRKASPLDTLDKVFLVALLLVGSHAWYYPADLQTVTEIETPFLFPFQIAIQLLGFYAAFRLGFSGLSRAVIAQPAPFLLLLWGGLSIGWSTDWYNTFGLFRAMSLFLVLAVYLRTRFTTEEFLNILSGLLGAILIGSIIAGFFSFGQGEGAHLGSMRGLFGHKNGLGEFTSICVLVFTAQLMTMPRIRPATVGLFLLSVACLILSHSSNAIGTVAVGLAFAICANMFARVTSYPFTNRQLFSIAAVALVIGCLVLYYLLPLLVSLVGRDLTFTGRTSIWNVYLSFARDHPIRGLGWTTTSSNEAIVSVLRRLYNLPHIRSAHSAYVATYVELGYVGIGLYLAWLVPTFIRALWTAAGEKRDQIALVRTGVSAGMMFFGAFEATAGFLPSLWLMILIITCPPRRFGKNASARRGMSQRMPVTRFDDSIRRSSKSTLGDFS